MTKLSDEIMNDALAAFGMPVAPAPVKKATKTKTVDREELSLGAELDHLAALKLVQKTLEGVSELIEAKLKKKARIEFAKTMFATKNAPEALIGRGPRTTSSYVNLSKKGSNSAIDGITVKRLQALNISLDEVETVPARLVINPELLKNQDQLRALAEAVKNAPGLQGVDVVLAQPKMSHFATNDYTITSLAKNATTEAETLELLPMIANFSIGKFQLDGLKDASDLLPAALDIISKAKLLTGMNPETKALPETTSVIETTEAK